MSIEKQIKDMVADIEQTGMLDTTSRCEIVAEELYDKGYRKHIGEPADLDITRDGVEYFLNSIGYRKQSEGEWIENDDGQTVCSHCGETAEVDAWELELRDKVRYSKTTFCPNCGAKMKGGAE